MVVCIRDDSELLYLCNQFKLFNRKLLGEINNQHNRIITNIFSTVNIIYELLRKLIKYRSGTGFLKVFMTKINFTDIVLPRISCLFILFIKFPLFIEPYCEFITCLMFNFNEYFYVNLNNIKIFLTYIYNLYKIVSMIIKKMDNTDFFNKIYLRYQYKKNEGNVKNVKYFIKNENENLIKLKNNITTKTNNKIDCKLTINLLMSFNTTKLSGNFKDLLKNFNIQNSNKYKDIQDINLLEKYKSLRLQSNLLTYGVKKNTLRKVKNNTLRDIAMTNKPNSYKIIRLYNSHYRINMTNTHRQLQFTSDQTDIIKNSYIISLFRFHSSYLTREKNKKKNKLGATNSNIIINLFLYEQNGLKIGPELFDETVKNLMKLF